jgi:hypothetical protein
VVVDTELSAGGKCQPVRGHRYSGSDPHVMPPGAFRPSVCKHGTLICANLR